MGKLNKARNLPAAPFSVQGKETGQKTALSRYELCVGEHTRTLRRPLRLDPTDVTKGLQQRECVTNAVGAFALHGYTVCAHIKHKSLPRAIQLFNTSFAQENYNGIKQTLKK